MTCTYSSFARDLAALNAGLTIAATSGGSITIGASRWIACQIKTRGGLTLHTTPVQVTTTSDNRTISVTIAASAIESGDYPMELIISGAATNNVTQMVRLASWRFRDGKTITYTGVGAVVYPGEGTQRSLPHTVTLTQDAHVALSASVAASANLPTGSSLIQGMLRQITATSEVVIYDAEATSGLYTASAGFWRLHLPGFTPVNNGAFSTYYGTAPELEGGCDRLVTELGSGQAINLPAYKFDGSPQDPPLILFLNNGLAVEGGSPLPKGGSLEIQIKMNDADVSSAFAGRISLQLLGYVNRETGVLDTSMAGSAAVWQPGTGAVTLPEDLPRGHAAAYSVALTARKDEILNDRDFNASALADGAVLSTLLYFGGSLGYLSDLWYLLGNTIMPIDDRMILVPLVNGLRRLGGVALVEGYATRKVGTYLVDGVLEDTADQQAAISAALNGAIIMREEGEELAETEALRAIVSTTPGTQSPSAWSSSFSLTSGNQTISIAAISPTAIRSDYPDALLSGNSQGENNVPYYRVYVEAPGPTVYELDTPVVVSPTGTTTIAIASLDDLSSASLPASPNATFGLFGYGSVSGVAASGGSLATGSYRVAIANFYPSPNPEVTAIAHGDIEVLDASVSDLLNQSLPYARLTASFVQPAVTGSVTVDVDNARVFAVGGSVIINNASLVLQGGYEVTAKTDTTLTLTNLGASGSASPGATVPASGFVFPAGAAGPQGPQGDPGSQGDPGADGIDGVDGADGKTVLSGSGAPSGGLGADGDFYINTAATTIYGPKTGGAWGSPTSLIGATGTNGVDGVSGFGLRFTFSTSTSSGPSSGQLRFNNATYSSVTSVFVSEADRTEANITALLAAIADGSPLLVLDDNDTGAFAYFTLTSQTDNGSDRTLTVTHIASAGTLSGNVSLTFAARGATGATGAVSAATALILEEQGSAPSATANQIKIANVNNALQWVDESGNVRTVPISRTGVVREVWLGAGAMTPRTTSGAAVATLESTTNDITYDVLDFDQTTSEGACFQFSFPQAWNAGTIKAKFYWSASAGSGTVTWSLRGGSLADDDAIDTAYGTAQSVTDTLIATGDLHVTTATAAITIAGSPAVDDWCYFEVARDVADTLSADARLIGIKLQYTETATEPSAW